MLDRQTLDAFREGDRDAFARVMRTYGDVVRGAVTRFFSGVFDQEEAMQEIWLHLWNNRASVDSSRAAEVSGFIAVTARRKCIDIVRRHDPSAPLHAIDDAVLVEAHVDAPLAARVEPHHVTQQREVVAAASAFAATLKPQWRRFFELHFVEGLTFEEIGEKLGIGKLRCKYMKKVIATRARTDAALLAVLRPSGGGHAP